MGRVFFVRFRLYVISVFTRYRSFIVVRFVVRVLRSLVFIRVTSVFILARSFFCVRVAVVCFSIFRVFGVISGRTRA